MAQARAGTPRLISLFDASGDRLAITYDATYAFNQAIGTTRKDIVEINRVQYQTAFSGVVEQREFTDGLEVYPTYKRQKRIILIGAVRASTKGTLYDRLEELATAFDPALVAHNDPDGMGFRPLDFSVTTADTVTYPTGLIACRYYVRPEAALEPPFSQHQGLAVPFVLSLIAADPRRYTQAVESLTGTGNADNSKADYWSWPTLTIAMTGAGSATFAIANAATAQTLTLDLSGLVNGDSVAVDMESRAITVNGVDTPELYVSGDYFHLEPGSNAITVTNDTNASPTLSWRPAFSL